MAKEKRQVLLWDREDHSFYSRSAYFYDDLNELLDTLFLKDNSGDDLSPENKLNFLEKFKAGKIKHSVVVKNHNGSKEDTPFESIKDGVFFTRNRITKDSLRIEYDVMDANLRSSWRSDTTYCEFEDPRDLNDEEKAAIQEALDKSLGGVKQDQVFNLFTLLCVAKNVVWRGYSNSRLEGHKFYQDHRERTFLGFDTLGVYHKKDIDDIERVAKRTATCAWLLVRDLTGYELRLKDYPEDDFVEGLMASRYIQNEDVIVVKVGEPTLTVKDLFKRVIAKTDVANGDIIKAQVCLSQIIGKTGSPAHNHRIEEYLDLGDVRKIQCLPFETGLQPTHFKGMDNCLAWRGTDVSTQAFTLYVWDDMATTYDLLGSDRAFAKFIMEQ